MVDYLWLLVVAGGPLLLAIGFAYALFRRRDVSRRKFDAGERGAKRLYENSDPNTGMRR